MGGGAAANELLRRRLEAQRLVSTTWTCPADVVRWFGAVQAQDYLGALWAVGLRLAGPGVHEGEVERAVVERAIVRSWPMRGTLHFLAAADARWMIELLAPRVAASAVNRLKAAGIDEAVLAKARTALVASLEGGRRLTRPEAYRVLERARVRTGGSAGLMILWRLAHEGLLCMGARQGKQHTVVLLQEWLPHGRRLRGDDALGELACRYFAGHGPATLRDFTWWSGLKRTDAQRAIEIAGTALEREMIASAPHFSSRSAPPRGPRRDRAHALPAFDEFFVGYADRSAPIPVARSKELGLGPFDMLGPVIIVDGRLVATWKRRLTRGKVICSTAPVATAAAANLAAVRRALVRYARFVQHDLELEGRAPRSVAARGRGAPVLTSRSARRH